MKRCRTCVWWVAFDTNWNEYEQPIDEDTYEPKDTGFEVRHCEHPDKGFCERPLNTDGFALADGSGYKATLYTAEDFGCVLHEPTKEK